MTKNEYFQKHFDDPLDRPTVWETLLKRTMRSLGSLPQLMGALSLSTCSQILAGNPSSDPPLLLFSKSISSLVVLRPGNSPERFTLLYRCVLLLFGHNAIWCVTCSCFISVYF